MVWLRNICINTLQKGAKNNDDEDDNNNNNNNNNGVLLLPYQYTYNKPDRKLRHSTHHILPLNN
jgi:hypothetical protein